VTEAVGDQPFLNALVGAIAWQTVAGGWGFWVGN